MLEMENSNRNNWKGSNRLDHHQLHEDCLKGYSESNYLVLGGSNACHHCFCSPCVILSPPVFLVGSCAPSLANNSDQFKLYRQFWKLLRDTGLWQYPQYLEMQITARDDPHEFPPLCIIQVNITAIITLRYTTRPSVHCRKLQDATLTLRGFPMSTIVPHLVHFRYPCTCRHHSSLASTVTHAATDTT